MSAILHTPERPFSLALSASEIAALVGYHASESMRIAPRLARKVKRLTQAAERMERDGFPAMAARFRADRTKLLKLGSTAVEAHEVRAAELRRMIT